MKIAMLIPTPFPPEEGIGYHVYNLSKKLISRGHNVTVITRGSFHLVHDEYDNIHIIRVPYIPLYPFHVYIHGIFVNKLIKKIEHDHDLIHIHTPLTPNVKTVLPIVSTIHSSVIENAKYAEMISFKSLLYKMVAKFVSHSTILKLLKTSKINTTVSKSVIEEINHYYNYNNDLTVVGNGVDTNIFIPGTYLKNDSYILYVGRLSYRKGLFDLIDAAKIICDKYNIKFFIVGKGEFEKGIKNKVKKLNLENNVVFLGHVDRDYLIKLYQNATILVIPSHYESGPLVLLEAMSCGTPVISTPVGIVEEAVINNENGIVIPIKSPEKIAESISYLLENSEHRLQLGKKAREVIGNNYTWDIVTNKIEKCYMLAAKK